MDETHDLDGARPDEAAESGTSRRKMLRNVAAGVATIGAASVITNARTAQAADNDPLLVGARPVRAAAHRKGSSPASCW